MSLSKAEAGRFDRTHVELVAGNRMVVFKVFEGGLSHRFDYIKIDTVLVTMIVARGIP